MEAASNTLQQMQEKEERLTDDLISLKNDMDSKLDAKVDNVQLHSTLVTPDQVLCPPDTCSPMHMNLHRIVVH